MYMYIYMYMYTVHVQCTCTVYTVSRDGSHSCSTHPVPYCIVVIEQLLSVGIVWCYK